MTPEAFVPHRPRLMGLAYRLLGSVAGAEDVVQEVWLRWTTAADLDDPGAWLTTVTTRLCLDELRSARARRETYPGAWLPEPWVDEAPPPPGILGESLSMAFLLLLEELAPRERAAFLLREVFDEDYGRVAEALDTSEANARQLVRRAKLALDADRPRFDADPALQLALLAAFGVACTTGDLQGLRSLLADQVVAMGDHGGEVHAAARHPVLGPDRVARLLLGILKKARGTVTSTPAWINGRLGVVVRLDGRIQSVVVLESVAGRIVTVRTVLAPSKLRHLA